MAIRRLLWLLLPLLLTAQTQTPNLGLNTPARGTLPWDTLLNANWNVLDGLFLDVRNVRTMGAKGDGTSDDTAAFNAAVTAANTSGGLIYVPCGRYKLTSTITAISKPGVSFLGQNEGCTVLDYRGTGAALVWQMSPFTISPAGELGRFTLLGTSSASDGILSGQLVASSWHDLTIANFSAGNAIHWHNAGNFSTWTERNTLVKVTLGGISNGYNARGLLLDSDNSGDSFGYNRILDLKLNVSTGGQGVTLSGGFLYNSVLDITCNADNTLAGSTGPICVNAQTNWDNNTLTLSGEYQSSGPGTGTPYRVQVGSSGRFANIKGSSLNVLAPGGAQVSDNILPAASSSPSVTLVESSQITSFDTGSFTLSSVATTPQPDQRGNYGSLGLLIGTNIESPYVSMFQGTGNKFLIGTVATGAAIGQMVDVADVSTAGDLNAATLNTACNSFYSSCTNPGATDGNVPLKVGAFSSTHRAGSTGAFFKGSTGINEQIGLSDANFEAGLGSVIGTNIAHPIAWAYTLDSADFEVYEKPFQTALVGTNKVFAVTHGGNVVPSGHLNQAVTGQYAAFIGAGPTTFVFTFQVPFAVAPICSATPNVPSPTYGCACATTNCTVTTSASFGGGFSIVAIGNPN